MRKAMVVLSLVILGLILSGGLASAATLRVPGRYQSIQAAIDAARWGDIVLVEPGDYTQSIKLKPGVTVQSSGGAEVTIIRGDGSTAWFWSGNMSYTVLGADESTISGFTIVGSDSSINNYMSSPTITNNILTGNVCGVSNDQSFPIIANNTISNNGWDGIVNYRSSPTIADNIITNSGVGISNTYSSPTITNNTITANVWSGIANNFSSPTITNNTITGSQAGIHNGYSSPSITNNIITGNSYGVGNYQSFPSIRNNNLWGNESNILDWGYSAPTVADNISADPMFVSPIAGDYHLQAGSPCIDAGTNSALGLPGTDLDGNLRIVDGNGDGIAIVDMGAYEFRPDVPSTTGEIIAAIQAMYSSGEISMGTAMSLTSVLDSALAAQVRGNEQASDQILGGLIKQVEGHARAGKITQEAAALLIEAAQLQMAK